jgi:hypothetical protein
MTETDNAPKGGLPAAGAIELPSSRHLLRSTAIAAATALVLLVTVVLPAEYGVDLTGVGRVLGLTRMGEIKVALAKEAAAATAADSLAARAGSAAVPPPADTLSVSTPAPALTSPATGSVQPVRSDSTSNQHETRITLQPGEGKEVKLVMRRGARATYAWSADSGGVNFLTHGDTANAPANSYHTYSRGTGARSDEGVVVAAFDGMHGWFWRNRTSSAVTVTLRTKGDYEELKQPK